MFENFFYFSKAIVRGGPRALSMGSREPSNSCLDHVFILRNPLNICKYLIVNSIIILY